MNHPDEREYRTHMAYSRALESYCKELETTHENMLATLSLMGTQWEQERKLSSEQAAEIERLRDALLHISGTTDGTDCNNVAIEALKESK